MKNYNKVNYNKIRQILDRFYAGETSLEEEKNLRVFFEREEVPEAFLDDELLFRILSETQSEEILDQQFDEKILKQIKRNRPYFINRRLIYSLSGVAAAVLILLAIWMGGLFNTHNTQPYGTIDNPQLAFAQTRAALQKVSKNLNKGLNPVKTAAADFNKPLNKVAAINKMNQSLKDLQRLREMEKARELMQSINSVYINLQPNQKKQ